MEIKKLECPSCGAPLEWNAPSCNFCKTEVRYFEKNSSALPINLRIEEIEKYIVLKEIDFWESSLKSLNAPYCPFKDVVNPTVEKIRKIAFEPRGSYEIFKLFLNTYFILPNESIVSLGCINDEKWFLVTNLRFILITNKFLHVIPF